MLRQLLRGAALLLLWATAIRTTAWATTVIPKMTKCPVCDKPFMVMRIGSYNTFGQQARDLSSSPFARFNGAQTCPYCLYSAQNCDFDKITAAEKDALQKLLADFRLELRPEETKALTGADDNSKLFDQGYLGLLIARQCDAVRTPDARRECNLSMQLFYRSEYLEHEALRAFYRKQAIEAIQRELDSGRLSKQEQAMFTYLLGELLRQDGQNDAAIEQFAKAAKLARPLSPRPKPKDGEESCQWIIDWSGEQSCRARFAKEPAENLRPMLTVPKSDNDPQSQLRRRIALQTLAARTDRDAWHVLADFACAAPADLDDLIETAPLSADQLRIEPRLWELVQRRSAAAGEGLDQNNRMAWALGRILAGGDYGFRGNPGNAAVLQKALPELNRSFFVEVKALPTETIKDVADRLAIADPWASEPKRMIELNPQFKQPTDKVGSQSLRVIRTPSLWTETRLMANLHRVIRLGDRQAIQWFFRWCGTVGPVGLDRFQYYLPKCFDALADDTSLWSVPADLQASNVAEQRFLASCLRYLHGDRKATEELLAHLEGKSESEASLAADCFSSRRDPAVKEPILKHWETGKPYAWYAESKVRNYVSRIAVPADLPRLDAIAALKNVDRHDIEEEIITRVRLRELLQRSLPKKATKAPP